MPPELIFILQQFSQLNMQRPAGMGMSAIPLTAIEAHWRIYLQEDDILSLQEFADWITALDEVAMEHSHKSKPKKQESEESTDGRRTIHSRHTG